MTSDPSLGGCRRWVRRRPVGPVRRLDFADPTADLLVPGKWAVLPLVLLHPVLGAVDDGDARAGSRSRAISNDGLASVTVSSLQKMLMMPECLCDYDASRSLDLFLSRVFCCA